MPLTVGTTLGSHEVVALLGKGGMGEVYRARDTKLKRQVAIKILPEEFSRDGDRVSRFQREAEVLASLNHPNIAAIYDFQQVNDTRFLVLELVEGETLAERIQRSPIPVEEALDIAKHICEALQAAHESGITHRDLKPANVKITPDGKVKVLDFGLAKAMGGQQADGTLSNSPTLSLTATQPGVILGTAAYMSPEQAKGFDVDARSDTFSFGSVLFEMLTGRQAFRGDTVPEVLASVLVRDVELSALPANLNPRIAELLQRCFQKNPKKRWQAAGDLLAELETVATTPRAVVTTTETAVQARPLWKRAIPVLVTAILFSAIAATVAWQLKPTPPSAVGRFSVLLPDNQSFTRTRSQVIAISPDGLHLAYVADRQLFLRRLDSLEARPIAGLEDIGSPFFSPDGKWVAFFAFGVNVIKKVSLTGGSPVTLCTACTTTLGYGMAWEGDTIVFSQVGQAIASIPASGGMPETIVKAENGEVLSSPQLLPGGEVLLFTVSQAAAPEESSDIVALTRKTGQRQVVIRGGSGARYLSTGHLVYRVDSNLYGVQFDAQTLQATGEPISVLEDVMRLLGGVGTANFDFSNNGTLVYVPSSSTFEGESRVVSIVDRRGVESVVAALPPGNYETPRASPDGKTLAVNTGGAISLYELSGKSQMRRLTLDATNSTPIWSPDGKRIAYRSNREGKIGIFVQNADGTGIAERLTTSPSLDDLPLSWNRDGRIAFMRGQRITMIGSDRKIEALSEGRDYQNSAAFSPDGRWIVYTGVEPRRPGLRVFVRHLSDGATYQVSQESSVSPVWSTDGNELFYFRTDAPSSNLMAVRIQTTPSFSALMPVPLPIEPSQGAASVRNYDVLPDGRFVLLRSAAASGRSAPRPIQQIHVVLNWIDELKRKVSSQ